MKFNKIYCEDCLTFIPRALDPGSIDLIYIDPPFYTQRDFGEFTDKWSSSDEYLDYMYARLVLMYYALKDTGSFYLHCDPTMSHYLKIVLDYIFGAANFRNEVVWSYRRWTSVANQFQSMHDTILWYTKTNTYTFNIQHEPFSEKTSIAKFKRKVERGRAVQDKNSLMDRDPEKGVAMRDVWDISVLHPIAKERLGYPTQKPEALLERIIKASSNEGDIVADFFMGSGTTLSVAQRLNRQYLGTDISQKAYDVTFKRLSLL